MNIVGTIFINCTYVGNYLMIFLKESVYAGVIFAIKFKLFL